MWYYIRFYYVRWCNMLVGLGYNGLIAHSKAHIMFYMGLELRHMSLVARGTDDKEVVVVIPMASSPPSAAAPPPSTPPPPLVAKKGFFRRFLPFFLAANLGIGGRSVSLSAQYPLEPCCWSLLFDWHPWFVFLSPRFFLDATRLFSKPLEILDFELVNLDFFLGAYNRVHQGDQSCFFKTEMVFSSTWCRLFHQHICGLTPMQRGLGHLDS